MRALSFGSAARFSGQLNPMISGLRFGCPLPKPANYFCTFDRRIRKANCGRLNLVLQYHATLGNAAHYAHPREAPAPRPLIIDRIQIRARDAHRRLAGPGGRGYPSEDEIAPYRPSPRRESASKPLRLVTYRSLQQSSAAPFPAKPLK